MLAALPILGAAQTFDFGIWTLLFCGGLFLAPPFFGSLVACLVQQDRRPSAGWFLAGGLLGAVAEAVAASLLMLLAGFGAPKSAATLMYALAPLVAVVVGFAVTYSAAGGKATGASGRKKRPHQ